MTVRIGVGAAFAGDRIAPAADLAEQGRLDYLVFECLAERTLAYGQLARQADPTKGYHAHIERRLGAVLAACVKQGTTIVTNMGVANPRAAAKVALSVANRMGLKIRVAVVEGDDVTATLGPNTFLPEVGKTVREHGQRLVGANAYMGADGILKALDHEPHLVITGRVADPSLFLAPLAHRFKWSTSNWQQMAAGTLIGHLLECGTQITGGYFADPPYKVVPNIAHLGFPLAEVVSSGSGVITKLDGTGGLVSTLTTKEQLMYEVHDPRAYLTPDVIANFSEVDIAEVGPNRVQVSNALGLPRPEKLKVTVGFEGGFLAEAEFSYAGMGAVERANLAIAIVEERMRSVHGCNEMIRTDLIGVNSLLATAVKRSADTQDVRLRAAMRTSDRAMAEALLGEVESLWVAGPAGGGGYRGGINSSVVTQAIYIDRDQTEATVEIFQ